jgi:uncharacterized phage infection (PIP) family protein YhgE
MEANQHPLTLFQELQQYKKKYYTNQLLKGILVSVGILLSAFILLNAFEYLGRFNSTVRTLLFFSFLSASALVLVFWVLIPISKLIGLNRQISNEEAARQIGKYFPSVDDKLLNTLQLHQSADAQNALVKASIAQKTKELTLVKFTDAVHFNDNRRYLKYVLAPLFILLLVFVSSPSFFTELFTESSARIINFNKDFVEPAPFQFFLENDKLQAFKNEDYTITVDLKGRAIPSEVFLMSGGRKYKMIPDETLGKFSYKFPKLQKPINFYFDAVGFNSAEYDIEIIERPSLLAFNAYLQYPAYLGKANEKWDNIGNLVVPEGTQIQWQFKANKSDKLQLIFNEGKDTVAARKRNNQLFEYSKQARRPEGYQVRLQNQYSINKEEISYYINVIPDQFPKITMQEYQDTLTYNFLSIGGSISDDYGLSQLKLFYRITRDGKADQLQSISIPMNRDQSIQNFYYQLPLEQMSLRPGDRLEYFAQVWDNDGVNGAKSVKTGTLLFRIPDKSELKEELDKTVAQTENQIDKSIKKAEKLQKDIKSLEDKLRNKNKLEYQDKKLAEEIIKKRQELADEIKKLQQQNENINQKQEQLSEKSPELKEKMDKLKALMNELLDEETKKLYEELQKLLDQNRENDAVLDKLEEIKNKEGSLEKELERALEMFKQLQFEQKLEQTVEDLKELGEEQKKLGEETEQNDKGKDAQKQEEIKEKQEEIKEKFEEIKKDLENLEKMDKDLENPNGMEENNENLEDEKQEISEEMENSQEQLEKKQNKKAGDSQKKSGEKMQKMSEQLDQMQSDMEMEQMSEDMEDLRAILENLVKLSFDQEELMKEFRTPINTSDPRFIKLAQQQLKLRDDSKIIEDSLTALAKRVFQIQSFVTRELEDMNRYMDESSELIKERRPANATSKQQFAMTSMNNLALMLSEVLKQMQDAMQNAMSMPQKGKGKPQKSPSLGKMQQQLNQQIQDLQKSGKSGRQLSEELAKLAAEQERLRRALQELQKMAGQDNPQGKEQLDKQIKELMKEMEENEKDLVNKRLDRITKERQQDIESRLLESEKALRERGEEEERKAEQAKKKPQVVPPSLQQYFKSKEKQIELLKTVPPALSPYYKKKVDEYFEKLDK